ncbi:S-type anion channel SLAH4-like [Rhodamnia argentea]|uniref:S-type anion channel SLAH4-like n=1 Tax=Rhodamnia argentea TaxID=178133 RepID=A0A8B8MXF1_9MYRT|nr:S-type anion channel SLAH4-like [Rhodamnia argentea]
MEDKHQESFHMPSIQPVMGTSLYAIQEEATTTKSLRPLSLILTRVHAGYFGITLSISSQALLWKILSSPVNSSQGLHHMFHKLPSLSFLLLWCLAFPIQVFLSLLYTLKCFLHFNMVKQEFKHHVGVNYLFAPWVSWLLLLQSSPWVSPDSALYVLLWWAFVTPLIALDVKIYGQWFTTEKRFLSAFASTASHMTVLGNLVGARTAALMGWKESALCMFSLGIIHYLVIFVTLYQRLSGENYSPPNLRPTLCLFFAVPSTASSSWRSISGSFDQPSKMMFYLSLFIFASLACRPLLFKRCMRRFNVAWWVYSFSLTFLALSSAEYAHDMRGIRGKGLMLALSALSVVVFLSLLVLTALRLDQLLWDEEQDEEPSLGFPSDSESS